MRMTRGSVLSVTAVLLLATACNSSHSAKHNLIFAKSNLDSASYEADLDGCANFALTEGASSGEIGGMSAAGFLLGGIIGAAATHSAYTNSNKRLVAECMYGKGYRKVSLPKTLSIGYTGPKGEFNDVDATRELLSGDQLDEVMLWHKASTGNDLKVAETYLQIYPAGLFVKDAEKLISTGGATPE